MLPKFQICFADGHLTIRMEVNAMSSTHALHTERINLSPFTKDFRVWGALNENQLISFRLPSGSFSTYGTEWLGHTHLMLHLATAVQPAWPWQQLQLLPKNWVEK